MNAALARRILVEKRVFIVPVAILLVAATVLFFGFVYPLRTQVAGARDRAMAARATLTMAERDHADARSLVEGKGRTEAQLKQFYESVLPANLDAARRLTYVRLAKLAREANVQYHRSANEPRTPRDSTLSVLHITYVVEGSYENIREFLYQIESATELIVIDNIVLAQGTEPSSPLVLTLSMSTYYRQAAHGS